MKKNLDLKTLKITGKIPESVSAVGVMTGSSNSFFEQIKELDTDVFITGELKYDHVKYMENKRPLIIEAGHYETEEFFVDDLSELLKKKFPDLTVITHKQRVSTFI